MNRPHASAVLFTINVRSIAQFYERVAGLRIARIEEDHTVLTNAGFRLIVHRIPNEYAQNVQTSIPPKVQETGAIKLSFPIEEISLARTAAAEFGGCIYSPDSEWEYEDTIVCDGWDPDGNVFQVFQPLLSTGENSN